jgi:hypothetical protein
MQFQSRTLDKVQNIVMDMNYNSSGDSQLQTSTQVMETKQVSEVLIFNVTLTWLIFHEDFMAFLRCESFQSYGHVVTLE